MKPAERRLLEINRERVSLIRRDVDRRDLSAAEKSRLESLEAEVTRHVRALCGGRLY